MHLIHSGAVVGGGIEAEHVTLLVRNLQPTKAGQGAPQLFVELFVEKFCVNLKESCNTHPSLV